MNKKKKSSKLMIAGLSLGIGCYREIDTYYNHFQLTWVNLSINRCIFLFLVAVVVEFFTFLNTDEMWCFVLFSRSLNFSIRLFISFALFIFRALIISCDDCDSRRICNNRLFSIFFFFSLTHSQLNDHIHLDVGF